MSKGTKQIRVGKLQTMVKAWEIRLQALEETRATREKGMPIDEGLLVRIDELKKRISDVTSIIE